MSPPKCPASKTEPALRQRSMRNPNPSFLRCDHAPRARSVLPDANARWMIIGFAVSGQYPRRSIAAMPVPMVTIDAISPIPRFAIAIS